MHFGNRDWEPHHFLKVSFWGRCKIALSMRNALQLGLKLLGYVSVLVPVDLRHCDVLKV